MTGNQKYIRRSQGVKAERYSVPGVPPPESLEVPVWRSGAFPLSLSTAYRITSL